MIAYKCEHCGQFTIWGVCNEFNQHFCDEKCYEEYCEKNNYTPNKEQLKYIKGGF